MALTQTQVSELYVSIFNRASEGSGNTFWQAEADVATAATAMLATADAATYFGSSLDTDQAFIEHIYLNTLNKTYAQDTVGVDFWVAALATNTRGFIVSELVTAANAVVNAGDAQDQFTNRVAVSNYMADTVSAAPSDYATSTSFLTSSNPTGALTVDNTAATVTTANAAADALAQAAIDAVAVQLTSGTDSFVGTDANDVYNSANGTLAAADTILDSSTTDADVLHIETTSTAGVSARVQNVETINANGTYVGVGYNATTTSGTTDLNLSTSIVGGTANVIGASSINVANINAGTNISTLNVTSVAGGTRDTVIVDGGSASAVNITGDANGIDKYDATIAAGATLTVTDNGTLAEITANVGATGTLTTTTGTGISTFTVNAAADSTVTVSSVLTATAANLGNTDFNGAGNVTADAAALATLSGQAMTSTGTGTLNVDLGISATGGALQDIQADKLTLSGTTTGAVTTNASTQLELTTDNTAIVITQANTTGATALAAGAGTLDLKIAEDQTSVEVETTTGTLLLEATPDAAADTASGAIIDVTDLITSVNTATVVVSGAAALELSTVTEAADLVITATQMTGALTIGATGGVADTTVIGGSGADSIATNLDDTDTTIILAGAGDDTISATDAGTDANGSSADFATIKLYGEAGDDTISATAATDANNADVVLLDGGAGDDTITGTATAATLVGGTGNDTITGGAAVDTITGGTGNDTINGAGGADSITTGTGSDTVIIEDTEAGDTITDAVIGEDTIVLRGTSNAAAALDLADMTATTAALYDELGTNHEVKLTGYAAVTDLSAMVQLGDATEAYAAAANLDLTAGSLNDSITTGATSGDIDAGAGDDKITVTGATTGELTGGAGADTFAIGAAAAIVDFSATDILKVTAGVVAVDVIEDFTATAATTNAAATTTLTLADGVDVDLTLATLSAAANGYIIKTDATADAITVAATIVGSRGEDTITGSAFADTITGGEGADSITAGAGADTIILTESVSAVDTITLAATVNDLTAMDTIVDFIGGTDAIDGLGTLAANAAYIDLEATDFDTGNATLADAVDAVFAHADMGTADDAVTFDYGTSTYLAVNLATDATFDAGTDFIVEVTGYTGTIVGGDLLQ